MLISVEFYEMKTTLDLKGKLAENWKCGHSGKSEIESMGIMKHVKFEKHEKCRWK